MMSSKNLLLVDHNNILMRGLSVNDGLYSMDDVFTGGLYGFLQIVSKSINSNSISDIIICGDAPPYLREYDHQTYKKDRTPADKERGELIRQMRRVSDDQLHKFFDLVRWPYIAIQGFEADDIISRIVIDQYDEFDEIFIASNDSDLVQCLDVLNKVKIIKKNGEVLYTHRHLMEDYEGLPLEKILTIHAVMGTHNNVKGIPGYGPVKARALVKSGRKLAELNERYEGIIDRNLALIRLPHKELNSIPLSFSSTYSSRKVVYFLDEFNIRLTTSMDQAFEQVSKRIRYG